jgi:NADP-dependent 3-hydroxy acid dehydrogenase YdfG
LKELRFDQVSTGDDFIVVTGAGKGIGKAICYELINQGYNIIPISRTKNDLDILAGECSSKGTKCHPVCVDVGNFNKYIQETRQLVPNDIKIRALIINAGWGEWYPATTTPVSQWEGMISSNLNGAFNTIKVFGSFLFSENAQIIGISSDSAIHYNKNKAAYCSSKAGFSMFIKCLREELREKSLRVTEIAPSRVDTGFRNMKPGDRKGSLNPENVADIVSWVLAISPIVEIRTIEVSSISTTFGR